VGNYFHAWTKNGTTAQQFNLIKLSSSTKSALNEHEFEQELLHDQEYVLSKKEDDDAVDQSYSLVNGGGEELDNTIRSVEQSEGDEKSKSNSGCDAGIGLLALLPLAMFKTRGRRPN
jgi:hypothetical protein